LQLQAYPGPRGFLLAELQSSEKRKTAPGKSVFRRFAQEAFFLVLNSKYMQRKNTITKDKLKKRRNKIP